MLQRYHKNVKIYVPDDKRREVLREFMLDPAKDGHFLLSHKRKICWYIFLHSRNQIDIVT
jgi:hypothetical protein